MTERLGGTNEPSIPSDGLEITFGSPDQWKQFANRNGLFLERMENLRSAFNAVFNRKFTDEHQVDSLIFTSGHIATDDFMEILLLCGNAEWFAAQKLLRSMFERVVTLKYLHMHPDEAEHYLNYHWITHHKLINSVETTFKAGLVDPAVAAETKKNYEQFKDQYKITLCKDCGTMRPGISWTPKDLLTMTRKVGMSDLVVPCYYLPLQQAHPTVSGMIQRLTVKDGVLVPRERLEPLESDRTLCAAHTLALRVLEVEVEHFKLSPEPAEQAVKDFQDIWSSRKDLHAGQKDPPLPKA